MSANTLLFVDAFPTNYKHKYQVMLSKAPSKTIHKELYQQVKG